MSKIQSESNSQLITLILLSLSSCDQYVKDTIWKQFTTKNYECHFDDMLWPICQRYNLKAIHNIPVHSERIVWVVTNMSKIQSESNSQLERPDGQRDLCCDQYVKDTIWKQFTTKEQTTKKSLGVVTNMSKIQSESNSQLLITLLTTESSCDQYVKDTIWKQFTTGQRCLLYIFRSWPICQRYNLKAIHNYKTGHRFQ